MDRFSFDAAATLAKIREAQAPRPIPPTVPKANEAERRSVGTVGTVDAPSAEHKKQAAEIIDAAKRFQQRGGRA
jgi:hypothetical protein